MALIYPLWNGKCQCINLCSEWHQICHFFHWSQHTKYDSNLKQKFWLLSKKSKNYPPPPKKNATKKFFRFSIFMVASFILNFDGMTFLGKPLSLSLSLFYSHTNQQWQVDAVKELTDHSVVLSSKANLISSLYAIREMAQPPTTPISLFLTFATDWWMLSKKYYGEKVFR